MDGILERLKTEPAVVFSLVEALIVLAVAFGLDLSGEQVAALVAVLAVLTGVGTRAKVTPWEPGTVTVRPSSTDPDDIGDPPEDIGTEEVDG